MSSGKIAFGIKDRNETKSSEGPPIRVHTVDRTEASTVFGLWSNFTAQIRKGGHVGDYRESLWYGNVHETFSIVGAPSAAP